MIMNRQYNQILQKVIPQMIGSLEEFIDVDRNHLFQEYSEYKKQQPQLLPIRTRKNRGYSNIEAYVAQDKTELLVRYEKNNIYHINKKKYNAMAQEANSKDTIRKPLYQHRSFFSKPDFNQDYIAKEELKRKHNLLRAILRMKQTEEQPKGQSNYEQSFQRLYSGFRNIHPQPILHKMQRKDEPDELPIQKIIPQSIPRNTSSLPGRKRIEYEHCLKWAKKHNKNGDFFALQLGHLQRKKERQDIVMNRSLISQIGKKVEYNIGQHLQNK